MDAQQSSTLGARARDVADQAQEMVDDQMERAAGWIQELDLPELRHRAEDFVRRHPLAVLGGAVAVGLMAGRAARYARNSEMRPNGRAHERGHERQANGRRNARIATTFDAHPLTVGAVTLALGALAAYTPPMSRREKQMLKRRPEDVLEKIRDLIG